MGLLCITGMVGHFLLIKAFEAAQAAVIQPFAYLQTVFAAVIGVACSRKCFPFGQWREARSS